MWVNIVASAAATPIPRTDPGWTWSATIQLISLIVGAPIGGGLLWTTAKGVSLLWQKSLDSRKLDNDAASIVRKEMMDFNAALQKRIEDLEKAGREERRRWDEEMAGIRKAHAEEVISVRNGYEGEIRQLREEIAGLRRQMGQWAATSDAAVNLSRTAPTSAMKAVEASGMGEVLRTAYSIPAVGDE